MKKILSLICVLCLGFALCGCSSKNNEDILAFFKAFHNTLDTESGHIQATMTMESNDTSTIDLDLQYMQNGGLQVSSTVDLESNGNRQDDFLNFYIRDGKTYLNSMGTKSQSVLSNLGIDGSDKISFYDPFMNFTDEELCSFVKSSSKDGDTYSYQLDASLFSSLLDSLGTVNVEDATLEATIEHETLSHFIFTLSGEQNIEKDQANVQITIDCTISDFNSLDSIDFPSDLESY